jgi:hypothetical protein
LSADFSNTTREPLIVVHDEYGNIKSVAVSAGALAPRAALKTKEGELITQIEVPNIEFDDLRRNPRGISQNFRIDPVTSALIPRI